VQDVAWLGNLLTLSGAVTVVSLVLRDPGVGVSTRRYRRGQTDSQPYVASTKRVRTSAVGTGQVSYRPPTR
jgi:hypothetical protein